MEDNESSVPSPSEKQSYKFLLDAALARKREKQVAQAAEEAEEELDDSDEAEELADPDETEDADTEVEPAAQAEMDTSPEEAETEEKISEPSPAIVVPSNKNYFRIGEVAELLHVEPHVLRYWESEFSQIRPTKSGGQRVYNRKTVESLVVIRDLLYDQGFSISGARKKLKEFRATNKPESAAPVVGMPHEELVALEKGLRELIRFAESNTAF